MSLKKTDVVDVYKLWDGNWFVVSDRGNYTAIQKKDGAVYVEIYDGSIQEYAEENELISIPKKSGSGYLSDIFNKYQIVLSTSRKTTSP